MFKRRFIAGEDLCAGYLMTVRKEWYQWHWRVYKIKSRVEMVYGVAFHSYKKGEEVDIIRRGAIHA